MEPAPFLDEKLLQGLIRKQRWAHQAFYDQYYPHLCYFATQLTRNRPVAEEIANSALEAILMRCEDFRTIDNVKAYLYRTVKNRCIDYFRYEERETKFQKELKQQAEPTDDSIMEAMIMSEFLQAIYKEIEKLPPTRKTVFKLFYLEDLSLDEIAKKLNMKPSAVRFNKSKAVEQLRTMLFEKKLLTIFSSVLFWEAGNGQ